MLCPNTKIVIVDVWRKAYRPATFRHDLVVPLTIILVCAALLASGINRAGAATPVSGSSSDSSSSPRVTAAKFPFSFLKRSAQKTDELSDPFQQLSAETTETPAPAATIKASLPEGTPEAARVPTTIPPRLLPRRVNTDVNVSQSAGSQGSVSGNLPNGYPDGGKFRPLPPPAAAPTEMAPTSSTPSAAPAENAPAESGANPQIGVIENEIWGTNRAPAPSEEALPPTTPDPTETQVPQVQGGPIALPPGMANPSATLGEFDPAARVLAIVGDQPILAGDLLGHINERLKPYEGQIPAEELDRVRESHLQQLLPSAIDNKLAAIDFMRKIPPEKLPEIEERAYKNFTETRLPELLKKSGAKSTVELDSQLRQVGSSLDKMRRIHTETIMAQAAFGENVKTDYEPTLAEMLDYYREHAADYDIPERLKWEQLTARFDRIPVEKDAWRELAEMGNEVKGGAPWAAVAQRRSHGPTASAGGVYDWTTRGSLTSTVVEETLFSLPVGAMSRMFRDTDGFHIVRVTEHQPAGRVQFHEVQDKIRQAIIEAHRRKVQEEYLAQLRTKTYIWNAFDAAPGGSSEAIAAPPNKKSSISPR